MTWSVAGETWIPSTFLGHNRLAFFHDLGVRVRGHGIPFLQALDDLDSFAVVAPALDRRQDRAAVDDAETGA